MIRTSFCGPKTFRDMFFVELGAVADIIRTFDETLQIETYEPNLIKLGSQDWNPVTPPIG